MAFLKTGEQTVAAYQRLAKRLADLEAAGDEAGAALIRREMQALEAQK